LTATVKWKVFSAVCALAVVAAGFLYTRMDAVKVDASIAADKVDVRVRSLEIVQGGTQEHLANIDKNIDKLAEWLKNKTALNTYGDFPEIARTDDANSRSKRNGITTPKLCESCGSYQPQAKGTP
jgi:hypothetical protein